MPVIHIVGAGVAGRTLAAALGERWQVHLHEQRFDHRSVPTAYGMWPWALTALESIGAAEAARERGVTGSRVSIRTPSDEELAGGEGPLAVLVTRPDLLKILGDRIPDRVRVHEQRVADPTTLDGDLIIGADGVRSAVRAAVWGTGSLPGPPLATVARGVVEVDLGLPELREYWGRGAQFGHTPNPGRRTNWFATVPVRRFADVEDCLATLRDTFGNYPAAVRTILEQAEPDQTLVNDVLTSRLLVNPARGRYVLIGDAAHAMAPNLGRGACESIVDALTLADLLERYGPSAGPARYRLQRAFRPQALRIVAGLVMRISLADGLAPLRDHVLRALPARP